MNNNKNKLLIDKEDIDNSISFEQIVERKLPMGRYQYTVICLLSLIFIADGIEMSSLSLILPILKVEWEISESLQGLLGSNLFFGLFLGSLSAAFLTDRLGRKETLEYISIIQFVLGIYSSTLNNVYAFLVVRGLFGFLLGFIVPLIPTLCTEIINSGERGKYTVLVNCSFSLGQFIATLIAWFCLKNMTRGNWRLMLLICSFPSLLVFLGSRRYLRESPRYVILTQSVEDGIRILNEIIDFNNDKTPFYKTIISLDFLKEYKIEKTNESKEYNSIYFNLQENVRELIKWKEYVNNHHGDTELFDDKNQNIINNNDFNNSDNPRIDSNKTSKTIYEKYFSMCKVLFNERYFYFTTGLWLTWFAINFTMYGLVFIIPFFLNAWDQQNQNSNTQMDGMKSLILTSLGEGLSGLLAYFLVDSKLGRKYTLMLCQLLSVLFILLTYLTPLSHGGFLVLFLALARFFGKICFAVIYPLTAEIYHTSLRTLGIGASSAAGRIAACIMPIISIRLFYNDMWSPFLLFFFIGLGGIIGTYIIPYDTYGKSLDTHH